MANNILIPLRDAQLDGMTIGYPYADTFVNYELPLYLSDEYKWLPENYFVPQGEEPGPYKLGEIVVVPLDEKLKQEALKARKLEYLRSLKSELNPIALNDAIPAVTTVKPLELRKVPVSSSLIQSQAQLYDADRLNYIENVAAAKQLILGAMGSNGYLTPDEAKLLYIKILLNQGPIAADEFIKNYSSSVQIAPIRNIAAGIPAVMSPATQIVASTPELIPGVAAVGAAITPLTANAHEILAGTESTPRYTPEELLNLTDDELIKHIQEVSNLMPTDWSKYGWKAVGTGASAAPWLPWEKWFSKGGNWKTNLIKSGISLAGLGLTWKDELGNLITGNDEDNVYQLYLRNYLLMLDTEQKRRFSNSSSSIPSGITPTDTFVAPQIEMPVTDYGTGYDNSYGLAPFTP